MPVAEPRTVARPRVEMGGRQALASSAFATVVGTARHRRLVEPFCGGLAVALGLSPDRALLNDANPHLISFYVWLQKGLKLSIKFENKERPYYAHRARFNELLAAGKHRTAEAAQLFYYLNRTGYNGLCRFNNRGVFNVPFGQVQDDWIRVQLLPVPRGVCRLGVHQHGRRSRADRRWGFRVRRSAI
jgi:DNA adenine methylase